MPTVDQAIERLYDLRVGVVGTGHDRHERPHKPLLLLAVFDLLDEGLATPDQIPWGQALRDRFTRRLALVRKRDDDNTPETPFRHLASDGFWLPLEADGCTPLRRNPLVADFYQVHARFTDSFDLLVGFPENRRRFREALVARYFPLCAAGLLDAPPASPRPVGRAAEEEAGFGRSPAFRRKILEIYDHQCAACGLRIKLPVRGVSFVDAAHIIPFAESYNDHPSNGLALCKNHHWAMDRQLIAPGPDLRWHVSPSLIPHRSTGEANLAQLADHPLLPPHEAAFAPDPRGLEWRVGRLIA